jgi:hypothetical protein
MIPGSTLTRTVRISRLLLLLLLLFARTADWRTSQTTEPRVITSFSSFRSICAVLLGACVKSDDCHRPAVYIILGANVSRRTFFSYRGFVGALLYHTERAIGREGVHRCIRRIGNKTLYKSTSPVGSPRRFRSSRDLLVRVPALLGTSFGITARRG